jgi:hypothetical protein
LAIPKGIEAWNCKIPSMSQIIPKDIRRYVRLGASLSPPDERLNVLTRRRMLAITSVTSARAMIHETLVWKTL